MNLNGMDETAIIRAQRRRIRELELENAGLKEAIEAMRKRKNHTVFRDGERGGLTLIEVMIALAIFMVGSISIMALFVAGAKMHADATSCRTASQILESLHAEVRAMPMTWMYAKTKLAQNIDRDVVTFQAEASGFEIDHIGAGFDQWPDSTLPRDSGLLYIGRETLWYGGLAPKFFTGCIRGVAGPEPPIGPNMPHFIGDRVLQPRLASHALAVPMDKSDATALVLGAPNNLPQSGYFAIDTEWFQYDGLNLTDPSPDNGIIARGIGQTEAQWHKAGAHVAFASEYPHHPGYYYTIQTYPINTVGTETFVIIAVGYERQGKIRRVHTIQTPYSPFKY